MNKSSLQNKTFGNPKRQVRKHFGQPHIILCHPAEQHQKSKDIKQNKTKTYKRKLPNQLETPSKPFNHIQEEHQPSFSEKIDNGYYFVELIFRVFGGTQNKTIKIIVLLEIIIGLIIGLSSFLNLTSYFSITDKLTVVFGIFSPVAISMIFVLLVGGILGACFSRKVAVPTKSSYFTSAILSSFACTALLGSIYPQYRLFSGNASTNMTAVLVAALLLLDVILLFYAIYGMKTVDQASETKTTGVEGTVKVGGPASPIQSKRFFDFQEEEKLPLAVIKRNSIHQGLNEKKIVPMSSEDSADLEDGVGRRHSTVRNDWAPATPKEKDMVAYLTKHHQSILQVKERQEQQEIEAARQSRRSSASMVHACNPILAKTELSFEKPFMQPRFTFEKQLDLPVRRRSTALLQTYPASLQQEKDKLRKRSQPTVLISTPVQENDKLRKLSQPTVRVSSPVQEKDKLRKRSQPTVRVSSPVQASGRLGKHRSTPRMQTVAGLALGGSSLELPNRPKTTLKQSGAQRIGAKEENARDNLALQKLKKNAHNSRPTN